jgi:predicted MFS family arabinose efflux permease
MTRGAVLRQALALAVGAAVALGLARFSYALLLGPMRADLGWTWFTAGVMNTGNAAGYLLGALAMPRALARFGPRSCALAGGLATAVLLALHGLVDSNAVLLALRLASGAASAATFVGGGLLAARLGSQAATLPAGARPLPGAGLVLGLYYGGTGLGIVVSALLVPAVLGAAAGSDVVAHAWQPAWGALGAVALVMTVLMAAGTPADAPPAAAAAQAGAVPWPRLVWALAGYACFGLGYIGYMTFIISLLREQRLGEDAITAFYVLLGLGVVASSWLWAGLLQRFKGGQPLALLNGLLALATVGPVLSAQPAAVFGSGVLFGAVFLSVVASTTALVRHNLPAAAWPRGITGFTIVFAVGQIVGPSLVGLIADGPGGLARGLAISAALLALGSVLAALQRPLQT